MTDKLVDRLRQALDRKLFSMPKEQREAEQAAAEVFMKKQFIQMAFGDVFSLLQKNAAGIAFAIESKLVGRTKTFEGLGEEKFQITVGTVRATVEQKEDHIATTVVKGDPPEETRSLTFPARVQDGSIFLTRAESPMSIYPDDVLGDILEEMIELVD